MNYNDKILKERISPNFVAGHHVVDFFLLQNQDLFQDIYRNVIPLCKLLIILCGFYMKNNNSYTAHLVPVSFVYII